jgi:LPXTG-motif cell wall-anchored protein
MDGLLLLWAGILLIAGGLLYRRRSMTGKEDAV